LPEQDEPPQEAAPGLAAEPTVTIEWSESAELQDGETMPLSRANILFASLDEAQLASPGYDKTKFAIDCVFDGEADHYEGRQDFGDGDGSLIDHIEKYHAHYENNADWENHLLHTEGKEALEADKEYRAMLLHEFIPYLKLHCALSEMEQAAAAALQSGESMTHRALASACGLSDSSLSQFLHRIEDKRYIQSRKVGRTKYYRLSSKGQRLLKCMPPQKEIPFHIKPHGIALKEKDYGPETPFENVVKSNFFSGLWKKTIVKDFYNSSVLYTEEENFVEAY